MKLPWVNILLLFLLLAQALTGYFGLMNGRAPRAWVLWLHGIIAYSLVVLLFSKGVVILDTWRRRKRWTWERVGFLVSLVLLLLTLLLGLLWTFDGPLYWGGFSFVSLHIYVAIPLMALMLWHAWRMRFVRKVEGAVGRRLFLGGLATLLAGLFAWVTLGRVKAAAGLRGATRRFTGSYETGSFSGRFPVVSWIADRPPPVDPASWRLSVEGLVEQPYMLTYDELLHLPPVIETAILDCTGGWYTTQRWQGVAVGRLLARAGVGPGAASVTFESVTGFTRRFPLAEAERFILALGLLPDGEPGAAPAFRPLDTGHGFPARLVAPGRRGVEWVKWVRAIRVNDTGPLWQSPVPLQ